VILGRFLSNCSLASHEFLIYVIARRSVVGEVSNYEGRSPYRLFPFPRHFSGDSVSRSIIRQCDNESKVQCHSSLVISWHYRTTRRAYVARYDDTHSPVYSRVFLSKRPFAAERPFARAVERTSLIFPRFLQTLFLRPPCFRRLHFIITACKRVSGKRCLDLERGN